VAGTGLAVEQELTVLLDALPAPSPRRKATEAMSDALERILRERGYWNAGEASR
jgi:hypothetical protein